MAARLTWGPADAAALRAFYGRVPAETTRSVVVRLYGEPVAVVGAAIDGGFATLFSDTKPELEPFLRSMTVLRAIRAGIDMAKATGLPVLAWVCKEPGARILAREGFTHDNEPGWWRWEAC